MSRRATTEESLRCSFCHKGQPTVSKLISTPNDYPRAYICDECITVCASILEDERGSTISLDLEAQEPHPLLTHPLASRLLTTVERWIRQESLGADSSEEFAAMR